MLSETKMTVNGKEYNIVDWLKDNGIRNGNYGEDALHYVVWVISIGQMDWVKL